MFTCKDGFSLEKPTCGWERTAENKKIDHSQGFCCACEILNLTGNDKTRGTECNTLNVSGLASSSHCLKFSEERLKGYSFQGRPRLTYEIGVTIAVPQIGKDFRVEELKLSDKKRQANNEMAQVELVGDF